MQAHATHIRDLYAQLNSGPDGLSTEELPSRKVKYGLNTMPEARPDGFIKVFLRQFISPLIYVLIAAAVVSLFLREWADAGFIFAVLFLNAIIGSLQEYHAQRSAQALQQLITGHTIVLRGGESYEVDARMLYPGDIVLLSAGDKVPADLRVTSSHGLQIDESLLTGESLPVAKDTVDTLAEDTPIADRRNMAFAGTLIIQGRAIGIVTDTGLTTELGKIAHSLQSDIAAKPPLLIRMEKFTTRITIVLAIVIVLIAAIKLAQGDPWQEVFLVAVALAVSAIPEGLPVALTISLAIGMHRMARRNVIIRKLVAAESLGSCTYIASDKTGTLTVNELTVQRIIIPGEIPWNVTGAGTKPEGEIIFPRPDVTPQYEQVLQEFCYIAVLCNEGFLGLRDKEWIHHGDSVDVALLVMAHKAGFMQNDIRQRFPLLDQIAYEPVRGYAASLHQINDHLQIFAKGSLERILPACSTMRTLEGLKTIDKDLILQTNREYASQGYRILALASGIPDRNPGHVLAEEDMHDLTLSGLVAIQDPLREEVRHAVRECRHAGITVCMITGDHPATALAIGRELHMAEEDSQVVTGREIELAEQDSKEALTTLVHDARIFARVAPEQKLAIVRNLQEQGHYVAVTGDGANDAPALNVSHVGVAMGKRGSDVARESADLIITDDNFASIVAGIEEGRVVYQNIRKVIFLLISTGAAEIVLFILSMLANLPIPLIAVQLLWLNLVTNGIQDIALAFEPKEGDEMRKPPRKPREPIFDRLMIERVLITAVTMGISSFVLFWALLAAGWEIDSARNSTLLLMVLFENVHVFNSRSETRSILHHPLLGNRLLLFGTLTAQLVHIAAMYTPGLSDVLRVQPVSWIHWLQLLSIAMSILVIIEIHKHFLKRVHPQPVA